LQRDAVLSGAVLSPTIASFSAEISSMAKPKKALKSSKSKSVSRNAPKAKSRVVAKAAVKRAVAHKAPKAKPVVAKGKVSKVEANDRSARHKVSKAVARAQLKKSNKLAARVAEKQARAAARPAKLSERDERLAKLKAVAEQMAKAKAGKATAGAVVATAPVVAAVPVPIVGKDARKKPTRGLTAKEKALVKEFERRELRPEEAEARRNRLKNLIMLGKERTYLTYAEINDHLPDEMLDAEQIETIIGMINDMGILVYDEAPDAETLLMTDATPPVADEEAAAEAEAALSTVDSEFGRTTDPRN
jgi:RNA polymerase primary sigma factor